MVHRKLKPDQEDAELDGEEGEKKGKKVMNMIILVHCPGWTSQIFCICLNSLQLAYPRGLKRRSSRSRTWTSGKGAMMALTQMKRR